MGEQNFVYVDANYLKELEETAKKVDYYKGIIDGINMVADRKTEPSIDIIRCKDCDNYAGEGMYCAWNVLTGDMGYCHHARPKGSTDITAEQTEPTISKMEQVADEPQTVLEAVLERQTDEDRRKMEESIRKAIKDEQSGKE